MQFEKVVLGNFKTNGRYQEYLLWYCVRVHTMMGLYAECRPDENLKPALLKQLDFERIAQLILDAPATVSSFLYFSDLAHKMIREDIDRIYEPGRPKEILMDWLEMFGEFYKAMEKIEGDESAYMKILMIGHTSKKENLIKLHLPHVKDVSALESRAVKEVVSILAEPYREWFKSVVRMLVRLQQK